MIIQSVCIKKFRGFKNISFRLGTAITAIAGQNGTQKTTVMGILSQSFTLSDTNNPLHGEKPLCGGSYKSSFGEKFKLSEDFDKPGEHEWTLVLSGENNEYTVESIKRGKGIRFWKKGDRSKGSGYKQVPVIYLSLSRLFPIGEDNSLKTNNSLTLTAEEMKFYHELHDRILIIPDSKATAVNHLRGKSKNTLGVSTKDYDWKMNSAGQDNIGKILLAILSFRRLKENHKESYIGGILAIDEIDATLYPASQVKLLEALRKFASEYKIQIIFTTHSTDILRKVCEWSSDKKLQGQAEVVYLEKKDSDVTISDNINYDAIKNKLNVALSDKVKAKKVITFTEDTETTILLSAILKRSLTKLNIVDCSLGCTNLISLAEKKVPSFTYPNSIIVLDGDVKSVSSSMKKINKLGNILLLPGKVRPELMLAEFLNGLSDKSDYWRKIYTDQSGVSYSKHFAFSRHNLQDIKNDRNKAKEWFNDQKRYWGRGCANLINLWIHDNKDEVELFTKEYEKLITKYK